MAAVDGKEIVGAGNLYDAVKKFGDDNELTKDQVVLILFKASFPKEFDELMIHKVMETW